MRLALLTTGLLLALACSGTLTGNSANREACERYVAHVNDTLQPCFGLTYDADNLCSGVHLTSVDMTGYYDCLREHSSCEGAEPVLELDACEPPTEEPG